MHFNFITFSDESVASCRFRVYRPYEVLLNLGHKVTITSFVDMAADVVVMGKHFEKDKMKESLRIAKALNKKVIFDVCDDHFDREHGPFYSYFCNEADLLTCTNERMASRLKSLFPKKPVKVFVDVLNSLPGEPKPFKKDLPLSLIWFGHKTNFEGALPWLVAAAQSKAVDITVFSNMDIKGGDFNFVPFTPGWMEENLMKFDFALLPQTREPWAQMKSINRVADALNAGVYPLITPVPLYNEVLGFCSNFKEPESLKAYLENLPKKKSKEAEEERKRLLAGQKYVRKTYCKYALTEDWLKIILELNK